MVPQDPEIESPGSSLDQWRPLDQRLMILSNDVFDQKQFLLGPIMACAVPTQL